MYEYIKGIVTEISSQFIVVENNSIGYLLFTASPYSFIEGNEYKLYVYQNVREDELTLYGFSSKEQKDLFLKLTSVKGVGCKMALPMLASNVDGIIDAIERENILYLKKFPKIGDKVARQIILDLKGKLVSKEAGIVVEDTEEELTEALKALGYKPADMKKILPKIPKGLEIEDKIKEALKLLLK
ncbi:MAG: Holliday junction branch migration protein RuvA [Bacilli bacterium]|nr:Holliday junction branch migration protein RuvA [Bacilli bacterium]